MIAAEQDRQLAILERCIHCIVDQLVPLGDFGKMAIALDRFLPGIARTVEIAAVDDLQTAPNQRFA